MASPTKDTVKALSICRNIRFHDRASRLLGDGYGLCGTTDRAAAIRLANARPKPKFGLLIVCEDFPGEPMGEYLRSLRSAFGSEARLIAVSSGGSAEADASVDPSRIEPGLIAAAEKIFPPIHAERAEERKRE